jgi:biopolymer transport protein ExbB
MNPIQLVIEYLKQGGLVSIPLLTVFVVIAYTVGYRLAVLFKGRNIDVRKLYSGTLKAQGSVQAEFLSSIKSQVASSVEELEGNLEWALKDTYQLVHRYSGILNTAVLLAPLLGLLGTVIGMIETFESLADADLFSSSGGGIAGGISQALITTQFGLVVAIPGVFLSRYLKKVEQKTYTDTLQLQELLLQDKKGGA